MLKKIWFSMVITLVLCLVVPGGIQRIWKTPSAEENREIYKKGFTGIHITPGK
jgi:hypothetical protein